MLSTTGGKLKVSPRKILEKYNKIKKQNKSKNVVIGFGITEKTIRSLKKADGLVVGSAICKEISKSIEKRQNAVTNVTNIVKSCLLYTSPSPRDATLSRMPSSA